MSRFLIFLLVIDATKHLWDKVATSNDYITPAFPNLTEIWVNSMTQKLLRQASQFQWRALFIWGIVIDGLVLPHLIQVGAANAWRDVKVGDAIIASSD